MFILNSLQKVAGRTIEFPFSLFMTIYFNITINSIFFNFIQIIIIIINIIIIIIIIIIKFNLFLILTSKFFLKNTIL